MTEKSLFPIAPNQHLYTHRQATNMAGTSSLLSSLLIIWALVQIPLSTSQTSFGCPSDDQAFGLDSYKGDNYIVGSFASPNITLKPYMLLNTGAAGTNE